MCESFDSCEALKNLEIGFWFNMEGRNKCPDNHFFGFCFLLISVIISEGSFGAISREVLIEYDGILILAERAKLPI